MLKWAYKYNCTLQENILGIIIKKNFEWIEKGKFYIIYFRRQKGCNWLTYWMLLDIIRVQKRCIGGEMFIKEERGQFIFTAIFAILQHK